MKHLKITIAGMPGAGKTTVGSIVAKTLGYDFYSMGNIRRALAGKRGMSIDQFNNLQENTDKDVDEYLQEIGRREDASVVEGRMAWHFIPETLRVFVTVDQQVGALRILHDKRHGERAIFPYEMMKTLAERVENDKARYNKLYGVDPYNMKNFDAVVDTTHMSVDEAVTDILTTYYLAEMAYQNILKTKE